MANSPVIKDPLGFPTQPHHINAEPHMFDAFDHMETEISAGWVVRLLQERGRGWEPFTYEEINAFYRQKFENNFVFNRLVDPVMRSTSLVRAFAGHSDPLIQIGGGWIIKESDDKYYVTEDFVNRCFRSRPAIEPVAR